MLTLAANGGSLVHQHRRALRPIGAGKEATFPVLMAVRVRARRAACQPSVDGLHCRVIKRFRHKGLEILFTTGSTKGVDAALAGKLRRILARLNDGPLPQALDLPGYNLHPLKGERKGSWAVKVTGNWRLIFDIEGEDATDVDLVDYH